MSRLFTVCLLVFGFFQLSACTIYAGTSGTTSKPKIESRGDQYSKCLKTETPEECDKRINGTSTTEPRPAGGGY